MWVCVSRGWLCRAAGLRRAFNKENTKDESDPNYGIIRDVVLALVPMNGI